MFSTGKVVVTAGIASEMKDVEFEKFVKDSLSRHIKGDWGDIHPGDKGLNEQALKDGDRLMSVYKHSKLPTIWIITEWNRSATTVLFPSEY